LRAALRGHWKARSHLARPAGQITSSSGASLSIDAASSIEDDRAAMSG